MVGQTISQHRVLSKIGEGSMGVVHLPEDIHLDRPVAITTAKRKPGDAFLKRFPRQARAASLLSHQHIAIYEYGKTETGYFGIQLVESKTLSNLMFAGGLNIAQALKDNQASWGGTVGSSPTRIVHRYISYLT
jgi:serine/threonine protein kinase